MMNNNNKKMSNAHAKKIQHTHTLYIRDRLPFTANVRNESRQMLYKTKLREDISGDK